MLNALLWVLCAYIEYRYFFKILKYTGQIPPPTPSYTHEKLKFNQICAEFFFNKQQCITNGFVSDLNMWDSVSNKTNKISRGGSFAPKANREKTSGGFVN